MHASLPHEDWHKSSTSYCVKLFFIGVQLVLKGTIYRNNSLFFLNELGRISDLESDNVLQCITDKAECCKYPRSNRFGEWYFPNGSRIPIEGDATVFYRNRGHGGAVNLNRASHQLEVVPPTGHYCCRVPNAADVNQTLCANILCKTMQYNIIVDILARFEFGDLHGEFFEGHQILIDTCLPNIQIIEFKLILMLTKVSRYAECLSHYVSHACMHYM
jgi:hypothetical protein